MQYSNMNRQQYPDMTRQYEDALQTLGEAIKMARAGEYRKGYLGILLEGLTMVKAASHQVGRHHRDGRMLDALIEECQEAMQSSDPVQQEEESPLADLFNQHYETDPEELDGVDDRSQKA